MHFLQKMHVCLDGVIALQRVRSSGGVKNSGGILGSFWDGGWAI